MVGATEPFTDLAVARYVGWRSDKLSPFLGMRHKTTGNEHGVVRALFTDGGNIGEATCKDGACHGLNRWIGKDKVRVQQIRDN